MSIRSRAEAWALRTGGHWVCCACSPLPETDRDERYLEWTAELPAILDQRRRFWPVGVLAVLAFSADQFRTTWHSRKSGARTAGAKDGEATARVLRPAARFAAIFSLIQCGSAIAAWLNQGATMGVLLAAAAATAAGAALWLNWGHRDRVRRMRGDDEAR